MPAQQSCSRCGASLSFDVSEGVCPACALQDALLPNASGGDRPPPLSIGPTIHYFGDYELLAEVGRGGMGVVYRARQTKLNRIVALKMILTGRLASELEVKRFQQEAGAAANLQHPNIVAVHEVGEHESQHYYSMDLVEGRSLAELAREQPLSTKQAARYIKIVADAINYAHEKGTLHRDIKPTNILIDPRDERRITDFGLARCKDFDSHLTASGQLVGTPAFMSPEQAEGETNAIGPASDVYSVGAVLYYLLTQRPPFSAESLADLLDQVIHREPVSPGLLNPSVPRDLQTISLKCLQKDPAHRFQSAQQLSDELGRFCSGKPILSRPPNVVERTWRWCARNRAIAGSLATAALVLVAGTAIITWQAVRAKTEAARSQQVLGFLEDMLKSVGPSVALGRDTTMLRELLDKTAERVGTELKNQPAVRADLQTIIGDVYNELGLFGKAEAMHRQVLATLTTLHGPEHADVATALFNLGAALQGQSKLTEAERLDREALAMRRKLLGGYNADVANSLENLAEVVGLQGKLADAETMLWEVVAIQKRVLGSENADLATSIQNLGQTFRVEGKLPDAERMERQALDMRRKLFGNDHPDVATSLNGLGIVLNEEGRMEEAETVHREALKLRRRLLGNEHPSVAESLNNLAILLDDQGRLAEAETVHREALGIEKQVLGATHPEVANSLNNLAFVLRDEGKLNEAESMEREALALWKTNFGLEHFQVATALNNLGVILYKENRLAEAEAVHIEALAMRRKILGDQHPAVAASLEHLAEVLQARDRFEEAEPYLRECLAIREKASPDDWSTFSVRSELGQVLLAGRKYSEAEPLLISGYKGLEQHKSRIPAPNRDKMKEALKALIRLYEVMGKQEQAANWKQKLAEGE